MTHPGQVTGTVVAVFPRLRWLQVTVVLRAALLPRQPAHHVVFPLLDKTAAGAERLAACRVLGQRQVGTVRQLHLPQLAGAGVMKQTGERGEGAGGVIGVAVPGQGAGDGAGRVINLAGKQRAVVPFTHHPVAQVVVQLHMGGG